MSTPKPAASRQAPQGGQGNSGAAQRFLESTPKPAASRQAPRGSQGNSGAAQRFLETSANAIDVRGLTKRFAGRTVVDHVDLKVGTGRICGFLGPNGSGKTTTIRMLCGLLTPDAGEGECLGLPLRSHAAEIRRQVGYMTQKFGLYEDLSIRENLDFIARLYELPQRRDAVDRCLDQLGLSARQAQLAGTLSGGWKQRLALASCLLHEPRMLLLDEPTAGVDPKARRDFWGQIRAQAALGITVLVSTHYMDEAGRCDELVYLADGRLLVHGSQQQIIDYAGISAAASLATLEDAFIRLISQAQAGP